jgi:hypothetical protein
MAAEGREKARGLSLKARDFREMWTTFLASACSRQAPH